MNDAMVAIMLLLIPDHLSADLISYPIKLFHFSFVLLCIVLIILYYQIIQFKFSMVYDIRPFYLVLYIFANKHSKQKKLSLKLEYITLGTLLYF